jgi:hypothetical protein
MNSTICCHIRRDNIWLVILRIPEIIVKCRLQRWSARFDVMGLYLHFSYGVYKKLNHRARASGGQACERPQHVDSL